MRGDTFLSFHVYTGAGFREMLGIKVLYRFLSMSRVKEEISNKRIAAHCNHFCRLERCTLLAKETIQFGRTCCKARDTLYGGVFKISTT